jgi:xylan 1,4-beta-xylosidase
MSLVAALVVALAFRAVAGAQTTPAVIIAVDATAPTTPLVPVWAFFGYDEANFTATPEGEALLRTLSAAHAAPLHVRTHFLFNTGDGAPALKWGSTNIYTEAVDGTPAYDFTLIDQIMDATVQAGALPLVELGFMPQALSTRPSPYRNSDTYVLDGGCFFPPRDYDEWAALVTSWALHVKERYPDTEPSWHWELWNEPDLGYWHGTFDEFARLYDYTEAALHAALPHASLGGPAVAGPGGSFLLQFLEHCAAGTNAVTGRTGTRLDMVSFHAKGGVRITNGHVQMDLGNQLSLHRLGFDAVARSTAFARTPIVISEADPEGCAACTAELTPANAYRNSPAYGAYEVAMMKRSLQLADEVGVNLRGVLTWAFTFPGSPYFAGQRALATNGIHLPVLNAFKLLGKLNGEQLPVVSSGARPLNEILDSGVRSQPDIDGLAAVDENRIQILVWNYHDDLLEAPPASVALRVVLPPAFGGKAVVTHTRVDEAHGDAFTVWVSQGEPATPSAPQLAALREAMEPSVLEAAHVVAADSGEVSLSFDLPRFGISLLTLEPSLQREREAAPARGCSCRLLERVTPGFSALAALCALLTFSLAALRRSSSLR